MSFSQIKVLFFTSLALDLNKLAGVGNKVRIGRLSRRWDGLSSSHWFSVLRWYKLGIDFRMILEMPWEWSFAVFTADSVIPLDWAKCAWWMFQAFKNFVRRLDMKLGTLSLNKVEGNPNHEKCDFNFQMIVDNCEFSSLSIFPTLLK